MLTVNVIDVDTRQPEFDQALYSVMIEDQEVSAQCQSVHEI